MAGIAGGLFLKLYLVILVSGKLALRGWFGILETFLQILWSCTLSNSPISNFLDMYLRLKHRSKNCWAIVSSDSEAPYTFTRRTTRIFNCLKIGAEYIRCSVQNEPPHRNFRYVAIQSSLWTEQKYWMVPFELRLSKSPLFFSWLVMPF